MEKVTAQIDQLKPKLTPMIHAQGWAWADVSSALKRVGSLEELQQIGKDPGASLERLATLVPKVAAQQVKGEHRPVEPIVAISGPQIGGNAVEKAPEEGSRPVVDVSQLLRDRKGEQEQPQEGGEDDAVDVLSLHFFTHEELVAGRSGAPPGGAPDSGVTTSSNRNSARAGGLALLQDSSHKSQPPALVQVALLAQQPLTPRFGSSQPEARLEATALQEEREGPRWPAGLASLTGSPAVVGRGATKEITFGILAIPQDGSGDACHRGTVEYTGQGGHNGAQKDAGPNATSNDGVGSLSLVPEARATCSASPKAEANNKPRAKAKGQAARRDARKARARSRGEEGEATAREETSGKSTAPQTQQPAAQIVEEVVPAAGKDFDMSGAAGTLATGTGAVALSGAATTSGVNTSTTGTDAGPLAGDATASGHKTSTTGTGAVTLNRDVSIAAEKDFDMPGDAGTFATGTGAVALNGATTSSGSNTFATGTGAATLTGDVSIAAGKDFDMSSAAGPFATGTSAVALRGAMTTSGSNTSTTGTGAMPLKGGTSASGNTNFDSSGGSGTSKTVTGALSLDGATTLKDADNASNGDSNIDFSGGSGTLAGDTAVPGHKTCTTGAGAVTRNRDASIEAGKGLEDLRVRRGSVRTCNKH